MASDTSTLRLRAGVTAILVFVVGVIESALAISSGFDPKAIERGAIDIVLPHMAANTTVLVTVFWAIVILNVSLAIFGIDLYRILADGRSGLLFAPVALIGGAGLFIIEALLMIGIIQGLAPAYTGATRAEQAAIEGTAQALFMFRSRMLLVAGVLLALAAINFGREMIRSAEFPDWMGYWGYIAGFLGIIGGLFPLIDPLFVIRTLGLVLFLLWILFAGIILFRN